MRSDTNIFRVYKIKKKFSYFIFGLNLEDFELFL